MKKLLLTTMAVLTILFAQGQTPCDSITVTGSQNQLTLTSISIIDYWITTAPDGTVLGEDSLWNQHSVFNYNPTGSPYDTILTCLFTMNTTCCLTYVWNGNAWTVQGGAPTPSWDCPTNTPGGCYDPGTGLGQYSSLAACQAVCGTPTPSWDCGATGCYDPGTGLGTYTSLSSCQSNCQLQIISPCDSIDIVGSQSQLTMEVMSGTNVNSPLYIVTTDFNGYIVGQDSLTWTHDAWPIMALTDSIITCITYVNGVDTLTCCVEFFWNGSFWAKMGSVTSIGEIDLFDKKLIKVVDILGRETTINSNQTLFFIYEDGTIEKRYIIDRK
ncbi:hypothetical protein N9B89_04190 [Flavobacteriales bacterium]|nr:hypothetical protein [Flavobacteriales bacterium]